MRPSLYQTVALLPCYFPGLRLLRALLDAETCSIGQFDIAALKSRLVYCQPAKPVSVVVRGFHALYVLSRLRKSDASPLRLDVQEVIRFEGLFILSIMRSHDR